MKPKPLSRADNPPDSGTEVPRLKPKKRPLYQNHAPSEERPRDAHAGLWFDKFCNWWGRDPDPKKTGPASWSLAAFSIKKGPDKGEYNPKLDWIRTVTDYPVGNSALLAEHPTRLADLARKLGGQAIVLKTTSRFATGLGREHPIENGFVWHPVLGVPYLPGSSVKGLVRAWATTWAEPKPDLAACQRIFGAQNTVGTVLFLDALPVAPTQLKADVMTPHYGDYYQGKSPPADWLSPTPIPFLTVAPGQLFQFALAPAAPDAGADCETAIQWLTKALEQLGAGAKTAVGYGRFAHDKTAETKLATERQAEHEKAETARREAAEKAAFEASLANLSPLARELRKVARDQNWETNPSAFKRQGVRESWMARLEADPQPDAIQYFGELIEKYDKGILQNPDRKEGKKNKSAYKDASIAIAKRWLALPKP